MPRRKEETPFFKNSTYQVAKAIFTKPHTTFHLRKLAKETNLSTTAVLRAIDELALLQIIQVEKGEVTTSIRADLESDTYYYFKRILNLFHLRFFLSELRKECQPEAIVLFGSSAKGEDTEESDIDLLILTHRKISRSLEKLVSKTEKELERTISMHIMANLDNAASVFKNAVANGIVLSGYLKVL